MLGTVVVLTSSAVHGQSKSKPVQITDEAAAEAEAVALVRGFAEKGDVWGQFALGWRYETGRGVPQDFAQAAAWYRRSAERGHAEAMLNLGTLYSTGKGVQLDNIEAQTWLNLAVARAFNEQQPKYREKRDTLAKTLTQAQLSEAQRRAAAWLESYNKK